jgi:alpha-beta hydrolase superfamily lysophospholipase
VVLDLLQCLIQRDLGLTSGCVRNTYKQLRTFLLARDSKNRDEWRYKKVVVVAHSQGALILSLAVDMLLSDVADEVLQRLEMYAPLPRKKNFSLNRFLMVME